MALNFPFGRYAGGIPFSHGYSDTAVYNREIKKCTDKLEEFKTIDTPTLLHISIGAAMDEELTSETIGEQYKQLFPEHLLNAYNTTEYNIKHIIISPNVNFGEAFVAPAFIGKTQDIMGWEQIGDRIYMDKQRRYSIYIFNTLMPSEQQNNAAYIGQWSERYRRDNLQDIYNMEIFRQTENDKQFIRQFYDLLNSVFTQIETYNGFISCFSYAVFNEMTRNSHYVDYVMFKEIMALFNKSTRILAEWRYTKSNFNVYQFRSYNKISYSCTKPEDNALRINGSDHIFYVISVKEQKQEQEDILEYNPDNIPDNNPDNIRRIINNQTILQIETISNNNAAAAGGYLNEKHVMLRCKKLDKNKLMNKEFDFAAMAQNTSKPIIIIDSSKIHLYYKDKYKTLQYMYADNKIIVREKMSEMMENIIVHLDSCIIYIIDKRDNDIYISN